MPHGALAGLFVLQALFLATPASASAVAGHDRGAGASSLAAASTAPCVEDERTLCLNRGRFEVRVDWTDFRGNDGSGQTVPLPSDASGLFYFFRSSNIEMLVKVLDGCILNDHFWVFFAATTNVRFSLSVRDTETGMVKGYENPLGNAADAITDTSAFATCDGADASSGTRRDLLPMRRRGAGRSPVPRPAQWPLATAGPVTLTAAAGVRDAASTCGADEFSHCLNQDRFRIEVDWRDFRGNTGVGRSAAIPGSSDSGLFTFFNPDNLEMLIKVLDGCTVNDHFWVFFAATTTVEFEVRVTDTLTNTVQTYSNDLGQPANAITDTSAFATCDGTPQPPELVLDAEEQNRARVDLPIEGGTVTATADDGTVYSLTFPPGALNQPETISLSPAAATTDSLDEVLAAVLLEPSGLELLEPARLEIVLPPGADLGGELVGFRAESNGSGFFLTGAVTDGSNATLDIPHFSAAGLGRVDDPFSAFCPFELLDASLPAANLARLRLETLTMALIAGCVDDHPTVAGQIVADIFEEWYLETVLPATQEAAQDPEASLRFALGRVNDWLAALNTDPLAQQFGAQNQPRVAFDCPGGSCADLGDAAVRTAESLLESLRLAVARADSRCLGEGLNDDRATLEWIDLGNVLVNEGSPQFQDAESVWRSAPRPLEIKTCGLQELRWQVGEASENPRAFLLPEVPVDIEITGHDGSGQQMVLDPAVNPFHEIQVFETLGGSDLQVDDTVNGRARVTPRQGGDAELNALTLFPRSKEIVLLSELQVRSIDLNGQWLIESLSTDNDCVPPAPVPPDELATVEQDSAVLTVRLADSFDKPLSGPLVQDSLDRPFRFELGEESSTTSAFCQLFNEDTCEAIGGCDPGDDAVPLFCRETQLVRGSIEESGDRATGESGFLVELTYDYLPDGSVDDAVFVSESCEGINQIVATRQ